MTDKEKVLTPITDRAAFTVFEMFGRDPKTQEVWWKTDEESTLVFVETARELESICEELAVLLMDASERLNAASRWLTNKNDIAYMQETDKDRNIALARYQQLKEKAK